MSEFRQIVVIGGGPAGCAAALSAIKNGCKDVTIIEKEPFGRHRIGEILLTQTVLELKDLGIADEISAAAKHYEWGRKFVAAYVHGKDRTPWRVQNNHPISSPLDQPHIPRSFIDEETQLWYTLMVRRHEFDETLRSLCSDRGVKFIHGSVKDFKSVGDFTTTETFITNLTVELLDGSMVEIKPSFIIDATGQQALIPRKIKSRQTIDDWGLQSRYTYFTGIDFDNATKFGLVKNGANILSFEDGWAWIAHLGRDLTSIGIVSRYWDKEGNDFWSKLKNLPEYSKFGIGSATTVDHKGDPIRQDNFYAHPNYRFRSQVMRGKNWACAGDSAMFLDPLLSQGVTLALSFGNKLGSLAAGIVSGDVDYSALKSFESSYISEIEVLNKVVTQWYSPDFTFQKNWKSTADNISVIFGRKIGEDIESFRWVSNLENIHHILTDRNDVEFLSELNSVSNIKMIHDFETNGSVIR